MERWWLPFLDGVFFGAGTFFVMWFFFGWLNPEEFHRRYPGCRYLISLLIGPVVLGLVYGILWTLVDYLLPHGKLLWEGTFRGLGTMLGAAAVVLVVAGRYR